MKRVVLVRHGETVWHAENRYAGRTDIALTPKGEAQARALASWAATASLNAVWSSPLSRARRTAEPSASVLGVPLQIDEGLLELDFGWGEGKTDAEMQEEFPARRAAFLEDPAQNFLPGGENPSAAAARGVAALYRIGEDLPPSGRALAVAHNTLLRLVLCSLLEIPLARYRNCFPILANTTLTEIAFTPTGVGLLQFNVPLDSASGRDHRDPT